MHVRWAISAGGRNYALRSTFAIELEALDEGGFVACHATLPVSGWGRTQIQQSMNCARPFTCSTSI